jgi:HEPN domain-containing protein
VNRTDLQQLAEERLEDARVLLQSGRYAAAYYLCGYAVECGLKACIARQIRQYEYPPSANYSQKLFTHKPKELADLAELSDSLTAQMNASTRFKLNWETVVKWSEQTRYENRTIQDAQQLIAAVGDVPDGVLEWIKQHW